MKPNLGELVTLVAACAEQGLITKNKAFVYKALEHCKSFDAMATKSGPDMTDVRILAIALQGLMNGSANSISVRQVTAEGLPHKVMGKHVFVSLGASGMLWCGPRDALVYRRAGVAPQSTNQADKHAVVIIDDMTACKLVPSIMIDQKDVLNSNGAGDAFCAGLVNSLYDSSCSRLDTVCVEAGMKAAHKAMSSKPGM
jgi:hypothetical protein